MDETQRVIDMYREGKKTREITAATGVPRSTIYYLLQREGITPRRKGGIRTAERPPLDAADAEKLAWAIERVSELDREVEAMQETITRLREALR